MPNNYKKCPVCREWIPANPKDTKVRPHKRRGSENEGNCAGSGQTPAGSR